MGDFLKVEGHDGLVRDTHSKAIINTNVGAYEAAIARKNMVKRQKDDLRNATREINTLKSEMHEIKGLLLQLVDKENGR
jgi:hypothetical protein|tara:strand:+ start:4458 stop:4694 length:237 start_codon:yes stop_codon:yes gene_type:complete